MSESGAGASLQLIALAPWPLVRAGDDLASQTCAALEAMKLSLRSSDVLVYAQKIVSKAEGRRVDLCTIVPGPTATALALEVGKDPRLVELVLRESKRIVRTAKDVLIVEQRLGLIMANAGIDQSNVEDPARGEYALLLPADPDVSAAQLRAALQVRCACDVAVIVSDSFGRPWRVGTVGVAIGCAGLAATRDLRGSTDLFGRALRVTIVGHADEIAAAASLLMGQGNEARPVVLVRGLPASALHQSAAALRRPESEDLFR